jgi:hypothetical protein
VRSLDDDAAMTVDLNGAHQDSADLSTPDQDGAQIHAVQAIWVNSAILAADSPFFRAMMSNGMKETSERSVVVEVRCLLVLREMLVGAFKRYLWCFLMTGERRR